MLDAEDRHGICSQSSGHSEKSMDADANISTDETKEHETKPLAKIPSCKELMQVMLSEENKIADKVPTNTDAGNEFSKMLKDSVEQYQNDKEATDSDLPAPVPMSTKSKVSDKLYKAMAELKKSIEKPRGDKSLEDSESKEGGNDDSDCNTNTDTVPEDVDTSTRTKGLQSEDTTAGEKVTSTEEKSSESSKSSSEMPLKNTTAKYTCVGPAQQISRNVTTKLTEKTKAPKSVKRTEKYIIKNVSKVSRIYKVSNLNYKIKPLRKGNNLKYPQIYIGEPSFVDLEDFWPEVPEETEQTETSEVNELDLYDLEKLKDVFTHTDNLPQGPPKTQSMKYPYSDIPHPTLNNVKRFATTNPVNYHKMLQPQNQFTYSAPVSINQGMIRIVARTVPSATLASVNFTSTSAKIQQSVKISSSPKLDVKQTKPPMVISGGFASMPNKDRKAISLPTLSTTARSVTMLVKPHSSSPVMTVKLVGANQTQAVTSSTNSKSISNVPVKIIQPKKVTKYTTGITSDNKPVVIFPSGRKSTPPHVKIIKPQSPVNVKSKTSTTQTVNVIVPVSTNMPVTSQGSGKIKPVIKATEASSTPLATSSLVSEPTTTLKFVSNTKISSPKPSVSPDTSARKTPSMSRRLREGVEVAFEDGVQHFISNLKHLTYLDDEPIKHWSDIKKGMEVAAMYTDGLVYDATIVGCYFERKMQPVVQVEKMKSDDPKVTLKNDSNPSVGETTPTNVGSEESFPIGCTKCHEVFKTIRQFRTHQRFQCQSPGIRIPKGTKMTDAIMGTMKDNSNLLKFVRGDEKPESKKRKRKSGRSQSKSDCMEMQTTELTNAMFEAVKETDNVLKSNHVGEQTEPKRNKRKNDTVTTSEPLEKCIKMDQESDHTDPEDTVPNPANYDTEVFQPGTKFLHRWQLDDGSSQWYNGKVLSIVSPSESPKDREFKVSYKGEDEDYILKLYEDYPTDIRIMGKKKL